MLNVESDNYLTASALGYADFLLPPLPGLREVPVFTHQLTFVYQWH